jgi:hypothetical protein
MLCVHFRKEYVLYMCMYMYNIYKNERFMLIVGENHFGAKIRNAPRLKILLKGQLERTPEF